MKGVIIKNYFYASTTLVCIFIACILCAKDQPAKKIAVELSKIREAERLFYGKVNSEDVEKTAANIAGKNKDSDSKFRASALLSAYYRAEGKFDKALTAVSSCGDYDKISSNSTFPFKSSYLSAFLELAHCKATNPQNPETREAFKMLDYAERNSVAGLDKVLAQFKYADTLFSLREFRKAETYAKNAKETGMQFFESRKVVNSSSSEELKPISGAEDWGLLKKRIDMLLFIIGISLLEEDYGEGYALYVKARMLYDEKSYESSMAASQGLITKYPGTIYEQAVRLTNADCLVEIGKIKEAKKELESYIENSPDSPYFGEAMMRLGKITLEREWDGGESAKWYNKALAWFRAAREKKDALDLYAVPEKVTAVSAPKGSSSSIDQCYRTVYRKEAPMEIINSRTTPWYIDENEKECLFMVGFFLFMEENFEKANECFMKVGTLSRDLSFLEQKDFPNAIMRLKGACKQKFMIARPEEMKVMNGASKLKATVGDLKYVLEKFDEGYAIYESMLKDAKVNDSEKAYALVGMGNCLRMKSQDGAAKASELYKKCFGTYPKTNAAAHALLSYAYLASYSTATQDDSLDLFLECHQKYPDTFYGEEALARLVVNNGSRNKQVDAEKYAAIYEKKYKNGHFQKLIEKYITKNKKE